MSQGSDTTLSQNAQRLLQWLQAYAARRDRATTDAQLAAAIGVPHRDVIDLRDELLQAGHIIVAETEKPAGSWLCVQPADLPRAKRYADSLDQRARSIFVRRQHLQAAIAAAEARQAIETNGQRRLF